VRIGQPLLPEFAAWRYAREYKRRNAGRALGMAGAFTVMLGAPLWFLATGPLGIAAPLATGASLFGSMLSHRESYWRTYGRIAVPDGSRVPVTWWQASQSKYAWDSDGTLIVELVHSGTMQLRRDRRNQQRTTLSGADAMRAMRDVIVAINRGTFAPSREEVSSAVNIVEQSVGETDLARDRREPLHFIERHVRPGRGTAPRPISEPLTPTRLAIEIALHEADERRAIAGELGSLYARWEEAERIAQIADGELSMLSAEASR
jgi:hypothetical protein